ncbi:MAG: 2-isopropylmalate synthase, partial [Acidobacteriaceae bacterium]
NPLCYEIMTPALVGVPTNRMVLGKHSGRHALNQRLKELGYNLSQNDLNLAYDRFVEIADRKKSVFDQDLVSIMLTHLRQPPAVGPHASSVVASPQTLNQ